MTFLLLGAPVEAKSILAANLARDLHCRLVDHQSLVRDTLATAAGTSASADELKDVVSRGAVIPDELHIRLLHQALAQGDDRDRVLLTDFPRTPQQAVLLDAALEAGGTAVGCALWVELSEDQLLSDLAKRLPLQDATIKASSFIRGVTPLKTFYQERGMLRELTGTLRPDDILRDAKRALVELDT